MGIGNYDVDSHTMNHAKTRFSTHFHLKLHKRTELVKATRTRFLAADSISIRDLLTPPTKIVDPMFSFNQLSPHSILFIGKSPKPFSLEGFIHFTETSNAKTTLMFWIANIIPIDQKKTNLRGVAGLKEVL